MNIFKFILNSKEPEVSRWDEVKYGETRAVFRNPGDNKGKKTKKPHKKLNSRIYMHKHK